MALDLNMGYYTIRLDPRAVEMFTIIFSMRQMLVSEVIYMICWFGGHFPSRNDD